MKWLIFIACAVVAVPACAALVGLGQRFRPFLLAVLAVTPFFGDLVNVNFVSMESYRGPDRGFEVSLTDLLALGVALGLLMHPGRLRSLPPGTVPCLGLFLLSMAGALLAPRPLLAAFSLFKALRLFLLFWVVFELVKQGVSTRWLLRGWSLMGCASALLVLKQKYLDGIYRVHLLFDHSNTVPLFLNLIMPILLAWALAGPEPRGPVDSTFGVLGALGMVGTVAMTYSRAGIVLAASSVALVVLISLRKRFALRSVVGAVAISLLGGVGLALVANSLLARFLEAPKSSAAARSEFNVAACRMAGDHVLGVGINQYPIVLTEDPRYRRFIHVMANESMAGVAHHIYWLTAAELGYAGLGLFLLVVGRYWLIALRLGFQGASSAALTGAGAAIGFGAVHLQGFFEWALRISPVSYQFVIVCGLVSGLAVRRRLLSSDRGTT